MKQYIEAITKQGGTLSTDEIVLHILAATVISMAIYISYVYTHTGTTYSKKFNVSLVMLTILTGTVMTVIGNNVALSLGMVGALSIVRFRTAIKDSRDTIYIFWAIIVGICCGVGDYFVAIFGSVVVFIVLLIFGRVRNENRILLIMRGRQNRGLDMEKVVFEFFKGKAFLRVKNSTKDNVELIYEMSRKIYQDSYKNQEDILEQLYKIDGMEYVNIVTQSDEISG